MYTYTPTHPHTSTYTHTEHVHSQFFKNPDTHSHSLSVSIFFFSLSEFFFFEKKMVLRKKKWCPGCVTLLLETLHVRGMQRKGGVGERTHRGWCGEEGREVGPGGNGCVCLSEQEHSNLPYRYVCLLL